jgi:hypothetical protein
VLSGAVDLPAFEPVDRRGGWRITVVATTILLTSLGGGEPGWAG